MDLPDARLWLCEICGEGFKTSQAVQTHRRHKHSGEPENDAPPLEHDPTWVWALLSPQSVANPAVINEGVVVTKDCF